MATKNILISVGVVMLIIAGVIGYQLNQPAQPLGSVARGSEYHYTTRAATTLVSETLKLGTGTFGGFVINVLGTGNTTFYDATTTNVNLRAGATTTLPVIAYVGASQAAGTYTYDTYFQDGLIAVYSGTQGTSSIMWR
jgi:hypothetical protein